MKRNRFIGSIEIAFHSLAPFAGMAIILRLIIEMFYVYNAMNVSWYDFPDTFGDKFTPWLITAAALFAHRKHTGLCAAVNLNAYRKVFGIIIVSLPLAALLAMFDVYMMNDFYNVITGSGIGEELSLAKFWRIHLSTESLFSCGGAFLALKLMFIYHSVFMTAYIVGQVLSSTPRAFWILAAEMLMFIIMLITAVLTDGIIGMVFSVIALICILPLALSSLVSTMIFIVLSSARMDSFTIYIISALVLWLINMCVNAVIVNNVKPEIKRIKLKR